MENPFEDLVAEVIAVKRKFPYLHRDQAWKMVMDEHDRKMLKGKR